MTDSNRMRQSLYLRRGKQYGISLIEVLVVLVILVVGILTVIRLFPSGFFSLESTSNAALADSLGEAGIQAQVQADANVPDAILPGTLNLSLPADANYDPDDPSTLNNARVVTNETISVPSPRNGSSVYVVNYGPIVMPVAVTDPQLANYLTINSAYWKEIRGDSNAVNGPNPSYPQDTPLISGQQVFLADYAQGKIAIPYAQKYLQSFILQVVGNDGNVYNLNLKLPHSGWASPTTDDPHDYSAAGGSAYHPDTSAYYNGNWFSPTDTSLNYGGGTTPPVPWKSVLLYRPFRAVASPTAFDTDPYEFTLTSANLSGANLGGIAFNPLAAGGVGTPALTAKISYQTFSWNILHEDRDVPALDPGNTVVLRLTLKNLLRIGDPLPDNSIFSGLVPGSNKDMIVLDLNTGQPVATPLNDEDTNGALPALINVSYAIGRLTLPDSVFGANTGRVRIFYAGDNQWTVAMQKAPAFYTQKPDVTTTNPDPQLSPGQFAIDPAMKVAYFPRCDAGKTVEFDGISTYAASGAAQPAPNVTVAIGDVVTTLGSTNYVSVALGNTLGSGTLLPNGPNGAAVTFTAVRGLSSRAVVAWKERDRWKVHTVDTVLSHPQ